MNDGPLVILMDLDNTLLDSDGVKADVDGWLARDLGEPLRQRFWELYEDVRRAIGIVSYPLTLERLHQEAPAAHAYIRGMDFLTRYSSGQRLYPGALAALAHLRRFGRVAVLSDGDLWFQLKKIDESGVGRAVDGNVHIFMHKEEHLDEVRYRFPASHYAFFDDKPALIAAVKERLGADVTTVWLRQGAYARAGGEGLRPRPDITLDSIAQAQQLTEAELRGFAAGSRQ